MQRLRSTWMALVGGILLLTLSISAAFGAPPTDGPENRGQTVAQFVHELIFGQETEEDEPAETPEESPEESPAESPTDSPDESPEESPTEETEEAEAEDAEAANHGECVSEVAHDKAGENDPEDADYANHGERVSEAARVLCWETDDEENTEEAAEAEEDEEADNHGQCVSEVAHDKAGENDPEDADYANHGARVSYAARVVCWEDEDAEDEAAENTEEADEVTAVDENVASEGGRGRGKANAPGQQGREGGGRPSWAGGGRGGR